MNLLFLYILSNKLFINSLNCDLFDLCDFDDSICSPLLKGIQGVVFIVILSVVEESAPFFKGGFRGFLSGCVKKKTMNIRIAPCFSMVKVLLIISPHSYFPFLNCEFFS